jgi:hypothetical protein
VQERLSLYLQFSLSKFNWFRALAPDVLSH